jgi:hypothetical protein
MVGIATIVETQLNLLYDEVDLLWMVQKYKCTAGFCRESVGEYNDSSKVTHQQTTIAFNTTQCILQSAAFAAVPQHRCPYDYIFNITTFLHEVII